MTDPIEAGPVRRYDAIVVGAGFSGLYQLHLLRDRLGLSVRVLEAAGGIGGTWYWNRYPGARCDSESYYYSYSFSRELEDEWDWTERYPDHGEIRRYLDHVADRFDLRRDIQLGTRVAGAAYDEAANRWTVTTESGECFEAQFLITAVGCLSSTNVPEIPGLARFSGAQYHTGRWPHDGVDFSGKRVGLIGTGSTGIQATPVIAAEAAHLTVFQRTANYSVPARNGPMDDAFRTWVRENSSELRAKARAAPNGHPFDFSDRSALAVSPQERQAIYEAAWERGGLRFRAAFRDIMLDPDANETASAFIRDKIRGLVHDPVVAETLTPRDHLFGTKRPPIDTHYFETFNRSNVKLVDLKATPIAAIVPEGVRTSDAIYPLDVIVFATGFDALTGPLLALDIRGRDGVALKDVWAAGPRSYLGLQVPGFPNLFTMTGPGSPSVLTNMPVAIEQHAEWITDCIGHLRERGLDRIEATPDAAESWGTEVNRAASATLLPMASSSWYLGANVPGKPRVFMPYAGGMAHYRGLCERVVADGYSGFALG
ncbi:MULTISPECIES: NAD(P)/FAD-dependent oxidoreductase [Methylobacterium]|jgi:cation diffusion facilitator CzcD-associated flavoprotein CzcO|uniref:flavin-containing monooxygenase n=1 Tax=Methylobacterium TaxID=407 RepID=UPI0008F18F1E|nr:MULTISPECIES: NAD(P)/FAD-dependent oxidoreductase [Methylobacterium]MBZ6415437.1 NAD(P)/FAD-dependent oxidoreductase [Methylobacterium sp.]MBK3395528.1 NAD(P)/FAD-dependent oxidoreductase [Methylobacterium ajmalii]MBK3408135.1 NAD(P)/FAD-dependent oxidoreductase [Methylobacterium ajmalii]MBK3421938.1 NAD(P)/FAD-dependent oxidoreductase [Methylobacterium ajmalii]SFF68660.1 cyclohexanone monooxygenase [Methylobacterium sp. yr596]